MQQNAITDIAQNVRDMFAARACTQMKLLHTLYSKLKLWAAARYANMMRTICHVIPMQIEWTELEIRPGFSRCVYTSSSSRSG